MEKIIYEAFAGTDGIHVGTFSYTETEKQIKLSKGKKVNKTYIGKCNLSGVAYAYDKQEAINLVKDYINNEIKDMQTKIEKNKLILSANIVEYN